MIFGLKRFSTGQTAEVHKRWEVEEELQQAK
jgi:hypothetical protein